MGCLQISVITMGLAISFVHGGLFDKEDPFRYAYGCLNKKGSMEVSCNQNELMTVHSVLYGGQPEGCNSEISKDNDCLQFSKTVTGKTKPLCDGKQSCSVPIVPTTELSIDEVISTKNNCPIDGELVKQVFVNYMLIKYECQAFIFCNEIKPTQVPRITVVTEGYPNHTITNPSCDCQFTSGQDGVYVQALTSCNGTATFETEESIPDPDNLSQYKTVNKRYFCNNHTEGLFIRIGTLEARSLKVKVDETNSSEYSSYSLTILTFALVNGFPFKKTGVDIEVTCSAGKLFLPYTTRLILYIVVPLGVIFFIAFIVLYCVCKKRRKRARMWRRKHVPLPASESQEKHQNGRRMSYSPTRSERGFNYPPGSPIESNASSPPSSRKKPDGKMDSDSDDLAEIATLLHKRNTARRVKELEQRDKYNAGDPGGAHDWAETKPYIPRTYSPYTNLDRLQNRPPRRGDRDLLYAERRCMSIGNLRQPRIADASIEPDDPPQPRLLKVTKSASHSRTSLRSMKRRAPQPPGLAAGRRGTEPSPSLSRGRLDSDLPGSRTQLVYVPGHYEEVEIDNHDDEDPDLVFDDPRYGSRGRLYAPRRNSVRRTPSKSRGGTPARSRGGTPVRSRADTGHGVEPRHQHDNYSHIHSPNDDNRSIIPSQDSSDSAQNSPRHHDSDKRPHYKKKPPVPKDKPKKGQYFNPYAVKLPPKPRPNRRVSNAASVHGKGGGNDSLPPGPDMPRCQDRRYSENQIDDSDHEFEDLQQVGVMDGVDDQMDLMDEDVGW